MVNLWKRNFLSAIWMSPFTSVRGLWKLDILGAFTFCWNPNNLNFFFLLKLFKPSASVDHGTAWHWHVTFVWDNWESLSDSIGKWIVIFGRRARAQSVLEENHDYLNQNTVWRTVQLLSIVDSYLQIIWEPLASKKKKNELGHDKSYLSLF